MSRARFLLLVALGAVCVLSAVQARADVYGRIRGVVTDPSGAVIPKAKVTALNTGTGISTTTVSGADGSYQFLQLAAPGIYNVSAEADGFKRVEVDGIQLNLNEIFVENLKMELGSVAERVTVTELSTVQVETTSIESGTTINALEIENAPLETRSFVDLMKLQPGVVEASDARGGSGYGNYASNGSEADQDSYLINGIDNNDLPLNEVQINVNLDAVSEFKVVTNTINPEYGRNSGAIVNAVVKSGTNQFHGSGFEFYRDTFLDSKGFFLPADVYHQNLFGGTVGGPVWKNHTFFFFAYQGNRYRSPESQGDCGCASPGTVKVFPGNPLTEAYTDLTTSTGTSPFPLVGDNGTTYPAGTEYQTIFPNGTIPSADINPVSQKLLSFVPAPTVNSTYEFTPLDRGTDDQVLTRIDHAFTSKDSLWVYALWERYPVVDDLPFVGATVPGFATTSKQHWGQYAAAYDHTFSSSTLNEVTIGYTRFNYQDLYPVTPTAPSSVGFSVNPQLATGEGLPVVELNGPSSAGVNFWLGFSEDGPQPRIDQTYQVGDSLSKIVGGHTLKMGFTMRRFEVYNPFSHLNDGFYDFAGAGPFTTGDVAADFLLGIPDSYEQASGDTANGRARQYYSYFQDQWKIRRNLTLTIGTGWSIDTPMVDNYHDNHAGIAFRPGQQSTIFPNAPAGYVFQGDPGVNAAGTTKYRHFGPRVGFAYSPDWGWLTGGPGKTSIRAGYGIYYNRFNEETATQTQGSPPFALASLGAGDLGASPGFANPFSGYALNTGSIPGCAVSVPVCTVSEANPFPYAPSANAAFPPLSVSVYDPNITVPDAQNYNLTIERQFGNNTIVSLAYVGSQGRHLLLPEELNPGINPAGCAANPTCISERTSQPTSFPGNFKYPGNIFESIGDVTTNGTSNYNALQATVNHNLANGLQLLVSYTYSHALDEASGFENAGFGGGGFGGFGQLRATNPFNPKLYDYGDSNYDARQRLVISYNYSFPSLRHFHMFQWIPSRITDGWRMNGTTTFQSGFPLDVVDGALPSLSSSLETFYFGDGAGWDVPNVAGPIQYVNPRTPQFPNDAPAPQNYWFKVPDPNTVSTSCSATPGCTIGPFSAPAWGTEGNAGRDIIHGPGRNNFDVAFMKETQVTESTSLELRFEFYNFFNHTQFDPNGITTDFNSGAFGTETAAFPPRTIQMAAKFFF
jgi:hypothetical protein